MLPPKRNSIEDESKEEFLAVARCKYLRHIESYGLVSVYLIFFGINAEYTPFVPFIHRQIVKMNIVCDFDIGQLLRIFL